MPLNHTATRVVLWLTLFATSSLAWSTTHNPMFLGRLSRFSARTILTTSSTATTTTTGRYFQPNHLSISSTATTLMAARKGGVSEPDELRTFVEKAGAQLLVVDVRNPDAEKEPGDQKSLAVAPLPSAGVRPQAVHLMWDRDTNSMPLPPTDDLDTPIITHCGGGGRGQLAKDFLMAKGFKNVLNGGGPKETDCWAEFGTK